MIRKSKLKKLLYDDNYEVLTNFKEQYIINLDKMNVIGDSEYETLKLTFQREFKKLAIEDFFNQLEKEVYE